MAFCNSCGTDLAPGARFCNKCGAAILASSPASASTTPAGIPVPPTVPSPVVGPPPPSSGGGALKAILIVVGVIVLIGILGIASAVFFALHVARHAHVRQDGNNVKVETPFGSVETTKDPQEAAKNLGVDVYPGAQVMKDGSTSASFGSMHTATVNFETSDALDKVCGFYKPKFPNAMVVASQSDQCNIVSNDEKNTITVNVKSEGDKTRIVITHVSRGSGSSSSN